MDLNATYPDLLTETTPIIGMPTQTRTEVAELLTALRDDAYAIVLVTPPSDRNNGQVMIRYEDERGRDVWQTIHLPSRNGAVRAAWWTQHGSEIALRLPQRIDAMVRAGQRYENADEQARINGYDRYVRQHEADLNADPEGPTEL